MNEKRVILILSAILLSMIAGFFIGRSTIKPSEPIIKYIKGDTISDTIYIDVPIKVDTPDIDTCDIIKYCIDNRLYTDLLPISVVENIIYRDAPIDTMQIVNAVMVDYLSYKDYRQTLFSNDEYGTCTIDVSLFKNNINALSYTYTPIYKEIESPIKVRRFSPFVGGGISTMPSILGQAGIFFDDKYGVSYIYQYDYTNSKHNHGINFLMKF